MVIIKPDDKSIDISHLFLQELNKFQRAFFIDLLKKPHFKLIITHHISKVANRVGNVSAPGSKQITLEVQQKFFMIAFITWLAKMNPICWV